MTAPRKIKIVSTKADQRRRAALGWLAFLAIPASLAILVVVTIASEQEQTTTATAPDFVLTNTDGEAIALQDSLAEGDTLLYFSMGVGCDGCFAQIPELTAMLEERDITMLSIMVDPPADVASEAERFGVEDAILIDPGSRVSTLYGMTGVYGHADRPSHSFALVNQDGEIIWRRDYAEMFVPADALAAEMDAALA
jgi:peroxiredoxin